MSLKTSEARNQVFMVTFMKKKKKKKDSFKGSDTKNNDLRDTKLTEPTVRQVIAKTTIKDRYVNEEVIYSSTSVIVPSRVTLWNLRFIPFKNVIFSIFLRLQLKIHRQFDVSLAKERNNMTILPDFQLKFHLKG